MAATNSPILDESDVSDLSADRDSRLGRRAARGAAVTLASQGSQFLLQMTSVVVLARLLSPHDYGLYAIGLTIVGLGEIFRDMGLSSAAIQAPILTRGQRDNLFWINAAIGAILMVLTFMVAPLVAALFHDDQLVGVTRALSVTFLINGVATQFRAGLNRQMRFGMLAVSDLCGLASGIAAAIVFAEFGAHYWALVGSQLVQFGITLVILLFAARWVPGRPNRREDVRAFLRFGWPFLATQIVNYASGNVDRVIIGLRLGPVSLGIYTRASQLLLTPLNQVRTPATTVALPVFSRLQNDPERAGRYLRRAQIALGFTVVPLLAVAFAAAVPITGLMLGPQWSAVAPILALFAVGAIFQFLSFVGYWIYLSRGLTASLLRYTFISLAINVVCIVVGSQWGLIGVAIGDTVAPALAWPVSLWWLSRATVVPVADLYRGAGRILVTAAAAAVAGRIICNVLAGQGEIVRILACMVTGGLVYLLAAAVFPRIRRDLSETFALARKVLQ